MRLRQRPLLRTTNTASFGCPAGAAGVGCAITSGATIADYATNGLTPDIRFASEPHARLWEPRLLLFLVSIRTWAQTKCSSPSDAPCTTAYRHRCGRTFAILSAAQSCWICKFHTHSLDMFRHPEIAISSISLLITPIRRNTLVPMASIEPISSRLAEPSIF